MTITDGRIHTARNGKSEIFSIGDLNCVAANSYVIHNHNVKFVRIVSIISLMSNCICLSSTCINLSLEFDLC